MELLCESAQQSSLCVCVCVCVCVCAKEVRAGGPDSSESPAQVHQYQNDTQHKHEQISK